ncbi:hypothetical protein F5I97DRAFT_919334 [Phlebopus sp. FC_14]|nr:hypothetical protein F5I97DRAFT_919334 [Phlebopus sp. FC_14]
MAAQTSRTAPSSPNPSALNSPRLRDWSNLKTGEPGSAFRGIGRGRSIRGSSARGGRGGPSNTGRRGGKTQEERLLTLSAAQPDDVPENTLNGFNPSERGGRPKSSSRRTSRAATAVVVVPASPTSKTTQSAPSTPSRSSNRRRPSHQPGKGPSTSYLKTPLPPAMPKVQKSKRGSVPAIRRDLPPRLAAAHGAEIRYDVDALVERVRAVAMADNRPTTPGSHIDWAGDEDDSLPDLDDWGVTTVRRSENAEQDAGISPILADTLKPLPDPQSEAEHEDEQEMESHDTLHGEGRLEEVPAISPLPSSCPELEDASSAVELSPSMPITSFGEKIALHPFLPPKPVAAIESLRTRAHSDQAALPPKPPPQPTVEPLPSKPEGLSESIHVPVPDERTSFGRMSSSSSSEQGLSASIHAPKGDLSASHSTPNLLTAFRTTPANNASHRFSRSSGSSPLGKHVYSHSRNRSTPPASGSGGQRVPQTSRPVISGEAISRLARTIGGLGPNSRSQGIPVTKDSTITS